MKLNRENIAKAFNMIYKTYMLRYGYTSYYFYFFKRKQKAAQKDNTYSKEDRKWTRERGFYPWRIQQYSLTEKNYQNIISDDDYYYLYPINSGYSKWIDDKLTMKYVLAPFDRYLPEYYYQIYSGKVVRLMNCPPEYDDSIEGVIALLCDKKKLAIKATSSSGGFNFYKAEARENELLLNGESLSRDELKTKMLSLDDFIITEYLTMHPEINRLNPESVNSLRIMVINEHGNDPIIPFVYMRIGTKRSGSVDNVTQGGMVCKVDVDTGRFYDAESLSNHVYHKETVHPDTKEPLEGTLPNWDLVKNTIIQIAKYMPQLPWLGYDVAITEDGFKILEVNSHQGLHKANEYPEVVNRFLFAALEKKKKKYGRN